MGLALVGGLLAFVGVAVGLRKGRADSTAGMNETGTSAEATEKSPLVSSQSLHGSAGGNCAEAAAPHPQLA